MEMKAKAYKYSKVSYITSSECVINLLEQQRFKGSVARNKKY